MSDPRRRLLDTAAALFTERGYGCVGINEIINKAEVAKASFYHHFPSKQDLCAAWLQEESAKSAEEHQAVLGSGKSLKGKVSGLFDNLRCWVEGNCYRGCPFTVTAAMTAAGEASHHAIAAHTEETRAFWQALAAETGLAPAKARDLGDTWFLLYSGALAQAQNTGDNWPVVQGKKSALALLASVGS